MAHQSFGQFDKHEMYASIIFYASNLAIFGSMLQASTAIPKSNSGQYFL
jgi:hypothetical protein